MELKFALDYHALSKAQRFSSSIKHAITELNPLNSTEFHSRKERNRSASAIRAAPEGGSLPLQSLQHWSPYFAYFLIKSKASYIPGLRTLSSAYGILIRASLSLTCDWQKHSTTNAGPNGTYRMNYRGYDQQVEGCLFLSLNRSTENRINRGELPGYALIGLPGGKEVDYEGGSGLLDRRLIRPSE
ncbi:hypothetical protein M569_00117 [Genlisea aurea]|uniref:Uncharacterized protein n=1 Tax=Genlisea aurea TaxID=192259 RepID=S8EF47_9LAMI|nr:hypothetical protein M569_00117 [Genlisea aurea]